jgi:hypothetical protein
MFSSVFCTSATIFRRSVASEHAKPTLSLRNRFKKKRPPRANEKTQKELGLSILVAPHHGLKSGYSKELREAARPQLVVMSERVHDGRNDGEVDSRYQGKDAAEGLTVKVNGTDEEHYSNSTRGYHVLIRFSPGQEAPEVFQETDAEDLLKWM